MSENIIKMPDTFKVIFDNFDDNYKYRYICYFTGRAGGGGKSTNIPLALLLIGLTRKLKILCAREVMNTIGDSIKSVLDRYIDQYDLPYESFRDSIVAKNGTKFIFRGLRETSTRGQKSLDEINIVFIDEADSITKASFEVFIPSIRANKSFIIMAGNPTLPSDFMYVRFGKNSPRIKNCYYEYRDYRFNPFELNDTIKGDIKECKERDTDEYNRVWLGLLQEKGRFPVCPSFSDANIVEYTGPTSHLILSCDFNVNPNAWVVAVDKGNGTFHIIDEILTQNVFTGETAKVFFEKYGAGLKHLTICGDASGRARNTTSEYTNYSLIQNEAIKWLDESQITWQVPKANGSISDRVQNFNAHILKNKKIKLFVSPKCKVLIYSLNYLEYVEGTNNIDERFKGNSLNELAKPHIFDAASYLTKCLDPILDEHIPKNKNEVVELAKKFEREFR